MYCNCSNKNNYEVISLCDIKKFSDKNGPFVNKAWRQISIADILMLDCNKPNIEKIEKIYITVNISSSKVIDTPLSPATNSEGMILTGKKLLIDGFICAKIVYTSLTREQSVYSSDFTIPFCTYIVLERNTDTFNDTYCIKTCIEDVFLSLMDCKTIFQNVTLFLLAEKTSLTCPIPPLPKDDCIIIQRNFLQNQIILNDTSNNSVLDISFDDLNKEILVTSTGNKTDVNGGANYFKFTLYESDGTTEKITNSIGGNESGMNFSNNISNRQFQTGDIITLQAQSNDKVIITNFPDSSTPRFMLKENEVRLRITQNGLVSIPATIPNEISVVNTLALDRPIISKISFDATNNKILATSTDKQINSRDNEASVLFKLRDKNDINTIKVHSLIGSNTIATNFATQLNNKDFKLGDIIETQINFPELVTITNFTIPGNTYIMANRQSPDRAFTEFFIITSTGLQPTVPLATPLTPQLPNIITVKFNTTKTPAFSLYFNTLDKILGFNFENTTFRNHYVTLVLKDTNGNLIKSNRVTGGIPTTINPLFNLFFEYGYILEIINTNESKGNVEISNFPTTGQTYISNVDNESFRITQNGLVKI